MKITVLALAALFAIAGCSSSGSGSGSGSSPAAPSSSSAPSAAYTPGPDDDAATIASHIPGCTGAATSPIGGGRQSGMLSSATCTITGHLLIIDTWSSSASPQISDELVDQQVYYAYGPRWTAFLADQGVGADQTTLQMQLTGDAAGLFDQAEAGGGPAPVPVATQKQIAQVVAAALHGSLGSAH